MSVFRLEMVFMRRYIDFGTKTKKRMEVVSAQLISI